MMFLTASSDNMQLDASCLSLSLLSHRRKPWMLKGTLCGGGKPQQFVLWLLDKGNSENSFPCKCTPSMTLLSSTVYLFLSVRLVVCSSYMYTWLKLAVNPTWPAAPSALFLCGVAMCCLAEDLNRCFFWKLTSANGNRTFRLEYDCGVSNQMRSDLLLPMWEFTTASVV